MCMEYTVKCVAVTGDEVGPLCSNTSGIMFSVPDLQLFCKFVTVAAFPRFSGGTSTDCWQNSRSFNAFDWMFLSS